MTTRETRLREIGTNTNVLMFDSMAKAIEIMSASLQANNRLLQDALEAGLANIEAGRNFLELLQKNFLQTADAITQPGVGYTQGLNFLDLFQKNFLHTADAMTQLGVSYTQGLVKMAESVQAAMKTGRA